MFKKLPATRKVIFLEILMSLIVIGFIWIDEVFDLPHVLFNAPKTPVNIIESLWETLVISLFSCGLLAITIRLFSKIHRLETIIPICSQCKKIRDDEGYWHQVESYITDYSDIKFSHTLCRDCMHELYPGLMKHINDEELQ